MKKALPFINMFFYFFFLFTNAYKAQNNCLSFDGSNDYVTLNSLATPLANSTNFTIEFWMKSDYNNNTTSPRVNLFAINPAAPNDNKFSIIMGNSTSSQSGQLSIYEAGGSTTYLTSSSIIGDTVCHHIAYVRSGSIGEAFIDGVSIGTIPTGTPLSSTDRVSLGQEWDNTSPSDFYNGQMDELRIWSVAKSQSQLQAAMNTPLTGNESNLIAYYNFNQGAAAGNNSGVTSLTDVTPNNYDGTLVNFGLTTSSSNWVRGECISEVVETKNALNFDGANDYVTINSLATPLTSSSNFTIEFWMKADYLNNTTSPRVNFISINPAAPADNKFSIIMGNSSSSQTGQLSIYEAGGPPYYLTSSSIVGDNSCHHIAYVRTGNTGEAFIDAISIGTLSVGTPLAATDRVSLGQEWDNTSASDFYNGEMDDLRVWNFAKNASQIQADMGTKLTGNESGLIAYYNFDQGLPAGNNTSITTLDDLSPNNYNGTLSNFGLTGSTSNWVNSSCAHALSVTDNSNTDKEWFLFPNPTTGVLNINGRTNENAILKIVDAQGRVVYLAAINETEQLNITDFACGLYHFIFTCDTTVSTYTIIKD